MGLKRQITSTNRHVSGVVTYSSMHAPIYTVLADDDEKYCFSIASNAISTTCSTYPPVSYHALISK